MLRDFDSQLRSKNIPTRSEALRQLIRDYISQSCWVKGEGTVYGSITISYDHNSGEACSVLTDVQHRFMDVIVCTTHVHADLDHCLEVIVVKGPSGTVRSLIKELSGVKAVNNLSPVMASIL